MSDDGNEQVRAAHPDGLAPAAAETAAALTARLARAHRRLLPRRVVEKLLALSLGRVVVAQQPTFRSVERPRARGAVRPVAVVAHVYYPELVPEILACWWSMPEATALHVTVPEDRVADTRSHLGDVPAVLHRVENRGRDIAPFMRLLGEGVFDPYAAVLKLHTKRSLHLRDGDIRRKLLFRYLAGSAATVERVLELFARPHTGVVGWRPSFRSGELYWERNEATGRALVGRMGGDMSAIELGFFEGSMFWFSPQALRPLRQLGLTTADFEPEFGQTDGALQHALERLIGTAACLAGHRVLDTRGRVLL